MNREGTEQLLDEFHVPVNVRAHSLEVARVAELLAQKLSEKGIEIDPEKMWIAGIIHDFVRVVDFQSLPKDQGNEEDRMVWENLRKTYQGHHALIGAQILEEKGEEELAQMIRRHRYDAITEEGDPWSWEEKVLYYADKRVAHDEIVSLEERLEEGRKRHFGDQPLDNEEKTRREKIYALEKEIFDPLDIQPDDLKTILGEAV